MNNSNLVAVALCAGNGVIDKLELETSITISDREFLAAYQAKLAAKPTRRDEDMRFMEIITRWALHLHKF